MHLGCTIVRSGNRTRKTYTVNGRGVRYARFLGKHSRRDVRAGGSAARRRRAGAAPRARQHRARARRSAATITSSRAIGKALQQKNAMLRGTVESDAELLAIYNNTLVEAGTQLDARARSLRARARARSRAHRTRAWTGGAERLDVRYAPNITFEAPTAEAVAGAFEARLARGRRERTHAAKPRSPGRIATI